MEETQVALPVAEVPAASNPAEEVKPAETAQPEGDPAAAEQKEAKPEKTPEQRELDRARRKIDRLVRQREELRAQIGNGGLRPEPIAGDNREATGDSDELKLSRAQLQELVAAEAKKLAPSIKAQEAEMEHRQKVVSTLSKEWGQEKFDALASDLDEAFGGLADRSGKPKPATDAIFESDDPKSIIEYLADPENADEAEAIGRMSPIQAGRAVAKLESKLAAQKAQAKPQPSKVPAPIETSRGSGAVTNSDPSRMTDAQFAAWRRSQIAQRR